MASTKQIIEQFDYIVSRADQSGSAEDREPDIGVLPFNNLLQDFGIAIKNNECIEIAFEFSSKKSFYTLVRTHGFEEDVHYYGINAWIDDLKICFSDYYRITYLVNEKHYPSSSLKLNHLKSHLQNQRKVLEQAEKLESKST